MVANRGRRNARKVSSRRYRAKGGGREGKPKGVRGDREVEYKGGGKPPHVEGGGVWEK